MDADSDRGATSAPKDAMLLKVFESTTMASKPSKNRATALLPTPATAHMEWLGCVYSIRYWSAAKWNAIPQRLRPANAILDDDGGAHVIEREPTSQG